MGGCTGKHHAAAEPSQQVLARQPARGCPVVTPVTWRVVPPPPMPPRHGL
ncbi:Hypothetical protein CAP_6542 [Chondromyces apiculatus DSM 436]|uniref:Uncharacterized protein n=1 Tax=Chondromyces apiculatus DSM 436 TaxID=1192034 RepID=A0A017T1C7_9BACT|nr:Hypothetical protein CAP_6542 [Chondromyces apiculatus DSM 436]